MRTETPTTLQDLLVQHPWPAEYLAYGRPLEFFWQFEVDVAIRDLWPRVADTSRMNRVLGLDTMNFEEQDDGSVVGQAVHGGVRHRWTELPWQWVAEREMLSTRLYQKGLVHLVRAVFRFSVIDERRTGVAIYFGWVPRHAFARAMLAFGFRNAGRGYERFCNRVAKEVAEGAEDHLSVTHRAGPELTPMGIQSLASGVDKLLNNGHPPPLVHHLKKLLAEGDTLDLDRIHVPIYARQWAVPETDVLRLFLHATRAGLLDLSWDVICPYCRGLRDEQQHLADLELSSHCEVCAESFQTSHPNVIEISFRVAPAVRDVPKVLYCSAEPSKKQHILVQRTVSPQSSVVVPTRLESGEYRVRLRGQGPGLPLVIEEGTTSTLSLDRGMFQTGAERAPEHVLRAGPKPSFEIVNDDDATMHLMVERPTWSSDVLRPHQVLAFPDFRDLFSDEYLREGLQLAVGVQTLLFTDMVGSTLFYAKRGDADAYVEVYRHFNVIRGIVRRHAGATVKTIGDAVMAVFPRPMAAIMAAEEIHAAFGPDHSAGLRLRISIHTGPVIAAPYNDGLDFFGRTVNVAAKLQSCADAGQVALSQEVLDDPAVTSHLASHELARVSLKVTGFSQEKTVLVWQVVESGLPIVEA